jgi:L-alanine-DL-glutamate epimerase-like enolase superfamily enzyme
MLELDDIENPFRTELAGKPFAPDAKGQVAVPTGPGLGIEVDEDVVRNYLVRE